MNDGAEIEIERLRSELQQAQQRIQELETRAGAVSAALDSAHIGVWHWDVVLNKVEWNAALYEIYDTTREKFTCTIESFKTLVHPDDQVRVNKIIERALTSQQRDYYIDHRVLTVNGEVRHIISHGLVMLGENGMPCRLTGVVLDTTQRVREEEARLAMQQELIEAQKKTLRELGAPIIPLAEGMLVIPLVGALDPERAEQVLQSLLVAVSARRAQTVILDVTGVPTMNADVARALMKVVPAVRLLGAEVILTGLQPKLARTLINLEIDMQQVVTRADLQEGLAYAAQLKLQRRA